MANDIETFVTPVIPAGITTSSITVDPTSINLNSVFKPFPTFATEELVSTAMEKLDKHVDQLEEDIDYFNNKLENLAQLNIINEDRNTAHDTKIHELEGTIEYLKNYTNFLEQRIVAMEARIDEKSN